MTLLDHLVRVDFFLRLCGLGLRLVPYGERVNTSCQIVGVGHLEPEILDLVGEVRRDKYLQPSQTEFGGSPVERILEDAALLFLRRPA